jgi:hypothetical protein
MKRISKADSHLTSRLSDASGKLPSLKVAQDFAGQPFYLLSLVEERVELDQLSSRLRDLA